MGHGTPEEVEGLDPHYQEDLLEMETDELDKQGRVILPDPNDEKAWKAIKDGYVEFLRGNDSKPMLLDKDGTVLGPDPVFSRGGLSHDEPFEDPYAYLSDRAADQDAFELGIDVEGAAEHEHLFASGHWGLEWCKCGASRPWLEQQDE